MKQNKMLKIGLTGGIGSGKSTISNYLKSLGIPIIDADAISRGIMDKYPEIKEEIKECFGKEFFDEHNELKRRELGAYVFKTEDRKLRLESIMIPYIKKEIHIEFQLHEKNNSKVCILDAPTLIEQGLHLEMDYNILVWIPERVQIKRVKKRDKLTKGEILKRIEAQMSLNEKRKKVDFIINNNKNFQITKNKINLILKELNYFES